MSPLLVQFMRRLTAVVLLLAALLLVAPRLLSEVGLWGPTVEERIAQAAAAVEAARGYGATEDLPSFASALRELEAAQALLRSGRARPARAAAERASDLAVTAQRDGLLRRDADRRKAQAIVDEADRRLGELEVLYSRAARGLPKERTAELLSLMKRARQAGSGLILLYEKDDFARVIAAQPEAFGTLDGVRADLLRSTSEP
jgi:hypothetical protein